MLEMIITTVTQIPTIADEVKKGAVENLIRINSYEY